MSPRCTRRAGLYDRVAEETVERRHPPLLDVVRARVAPARPRVRQHVENIYALVRLADEIVDGAASAAGLTIVERRAR